MADSPTCTWTGASGTKYTYYIHKLPVSFQEAYGNYIYSKASAEPNRWLPIYIGEGDLADRIGNGHHHSDAPLAARISKALAETGLEVWDPDRDLLPGDNWAGEVARASRRHDQTPRPPPT